MKTPVGKRLPLAYLAGVIDTQAVLSTREAGSTTLPMVTLHTGNFALLQILADATGVNVTEMRRTYDKKLCGEHCDEPHVHIESVRGRWQVTGAKATVVLHSVHPYLLLRQSEVADMVGVGMDAPYKAATLTKMRALGWDIPWHDVNTTLALVDG